MTSVTSSRVPRWGSVVPFQVAASLLRNSSRFEAEVAEKRREGSPGPYRVHLPADGTDRTLTPTDTLPAHHRPGSILGSSRFRLATLPVRGFRAGFNHAPINSARSFHSLLKCGTLVVMLVDRDSGSVSCFQPQLLKGLSALTICRAELRGTNATPKLPSVQGPHTIEFDPVRPLWLAPPNLHFM